MKKLCLFLSILGIGSAYGQADRNTYLNAVKAEMQKTWPNNRTINIVFHGHSVPSGYFKTPQVNTLAAYPHQTLVALKELYPTAVLNCITTSIGGENSEQGAKRFKSEVLCHKPDVLYIDYSLNDRAIGLERAYAAWDKMIKKALKRNIKVILCTPTPDISKDWRNDVNPLKAHADQVRALAVKYQVGLVDSYAAFDNKAESDENIQLYMAQNNHPNEKGHLVVVAEIMKWFTLTNNQ